MNQMNEPTPARSFSISIAISVILFVLLAPVAVNQAVPVIHAQGPTRVADPTISVLEKKKLEQEVRKLELENDPWRTWLTNLTPLIVVLGGLFGFIKWRKEQRDRERDRLDQQTKIERDRREQQTEIERDRREQRDKQREDQRQEREKRTEERFLRTVEGLGSRSPAMQTASAVMLRTFLQPDYKQYHAQIFDLAVTQLRLIRTITHVNSPVPPNALDQALITVFKESIPLVRAQMNADRTSDRYLLDAAGVPLYSADLAGTNLDDVRMPGADLRFAELSNRRGKDDYAISSLCSANLDNADLSGAKLERVMFLWATLRGAQLKGANLKGSDSQRADLSGAILTDATLEDVDLRQAHLSGANPEKAQTLKGAHLYGVTGLSGEQRAACEAKGAIFAEDKPPPPDLFETLGVRPPGKIS
jgi:uncharacterized protein YjbI with pentapeptide repeats